MSRKLQQEEIILRNQKFFTVKTFTQNGDYSLQECGSVSFLSFKLIVRDPIEE